MPPQYMSGSKTPAMYPEGRDDIMNAKAVSATTPIIATLNLFMHHLDRIGENHLC